MKRNSKAHKSRLREAIEIEKAIAPTSNPACRCLFIDFSDFTDDQLDRYRDLTKPGPSPCATCGRSCLVPRDALTGAEEAELAALEALVKVATAPIGTRYDTEPTGGVA